jgi:D-alanyl-D-alanine dipeptidase
MNTELVFVDDVVSGLRWDAKYATCDNFTGRPVDGYRVNRIAATRELCAGLTAARDRAAGLGLGLLLWDAYRPQRATEEFLRWAEQPDDGVRKARHYPRVERARLFELGYIDRRSGHTRGAAVDLTLYELDGGAVLPMGGDHDLMDPISHHAAVGLSHRERANRRVLRSIMEHSGFDAYEPEWWHYALRDEPHPDRYFDCEICDD